MAEKNRKQEGGPIVAGLTRAYWMEPETVMNYLANSVDLDGVRAEEIKKSLQADIQQELTHAQSLARRIKELGGRVPGSMDFSAEQSSLQPPKRSTDVATVIRGVLDAENAAIEHYNDMIRLCDGKDYVTQDLCITLLSDEEAHRREFRGFLMEYSDKT
jgi:bacterioferritin